MQYLRVPKPVFSFPGTGIQLAVSDTDTAPEGLFFELVKPPRHGIVLKQGAGVQEHMGAGELSRNLPQCRGGGEHGPVHAAGLVGQEEMDASDRIQYVSSLPGRVGLRERVREGCFPVCCLVPG